MTAKKPSTTAKATTQKTAAETKADEVAALMGDDIETSATQKPSAPPALKGAAKTEPEVEVNAPEETEDKPETVDQTDTESADESDDLDTDDEESDDQDDEQEDLPATEKASRMVILSKTIQTKDASGNDVKFIASKDPQDLGEYAAMAIAAKCAKPHKAG